MKRRSAPKPRSARAKRAAKTVRKNRTPVRTKPPDAIDSMIAASAQTLNLPVDPAWHGGVRFNLQLILRLASLVDDFALPDDIEPAPVFHA
jgi:Protein of unknown function (DUF4089)